MKTYLFLFSVGPVQSFIAQARKTQDLYAGSKILSELIYAGYSGYKDVIDLIFPNKIESNGSIPNRFLGVVKAEHETELQQMGECIEEATKNKFRELAEEAVKSSKANIREIQKAFFQQIDNHLEVNWIFHELHGDSDGEYRRAYQEIESLMGGVKNIRIFEQYTHQLPDNFGEAGRKCSLDGERNALVFGNNSNIRYSTQGIVLKDLKINENEGLSAVSFTKRFFQGEKMKAFPSTSEIAAKNIISVTPGIYSIYRECFSGEIDEQLFFKENLNERYLRKNGYEEVLNKCSIETLHNCWKGVFKGKNPISYYALVAFDGDRMGKIMSGHPDVYQGNDLKEYQRKVSGLLLNFADIVKEYLNKHTQIGAVVYTGGDDFLGFINLVSLFDTVKWLRESFDEMVNKRLKSDFASDFNFTFSAGIAIAHYKAPLSIVLDKARAMEKLAKSDGNLSGGRDAFAICTIKKSGELHTASFKWRMDADLLHWKALEDLVGYFKAQYCSESFLRNLIRELIVLQNDRGEIEKNGILELELNRLVKRALTEKGKVQKKEEEIKKTVLSLIIEKNNRFLLSDLAEAVGIALFLKRNG